VFPLITGDSESLLRNGRNPMTVLIESQAKVIFILLARVPVSASLFSLLLRKPHRRHSSINDATSAVHPV
jgi:hypothetical protein